MAKTDGVMIDWLEGLKKFEKDFTLRLEINDLANNWKELYPKLDIRKQLVAAHAWYLSNPVKAPKVYKSRFLNSWMRRAQEWLISSPAYSMPERRVVPLPPPPDMSKEDFDEMHRQSVKALGPTMCKEDHCDVCGK